MREVDEKTNKVIIKGIVDYSRSTPTHFVVKTDRGGVASYSRQFFISEYEIIRYGVQHVYNH